MASRWQRSPDNALRRAGELLEVGRKQDALDTLHDVIKRTKTRLWTKVHEQIMHKHLELCVELRKPHIAKDALFQYRNMCQQLNVKSLEDVITTFLAAAEKRAEVAKQESHGLVEDVEDLDQAESPEKLLMSAVTGEGAQERTDRTILSPWLRFLWESYRQCLELLRNNSQVEVIYHRVAKQAFRFCCNYGRKTEFRKLSDNLRMHLLQVQKTQQSLTQPHFALKLSNPETLAMHQDTRLAQLDIALQMELWQEAFRSVEDAHHLMQLSKKPSKTSSLASYFEKLSLIFAKAGKDLYHAAALLKLFQLTREWKKTASAEELSQLATRALLAALSVTSSGAPSELSRHLEIEELQLENQRRLASLINLPSPPTRQSLLRDVLRLNVLAFALPSAQKLYKLLEADFNPLNLAPEVNKVLDIAESSVYDTYFDYIKEVAALKVVKQVSHIYSSAKFSYLSKLIPYYDRQAIERLIVSASKKFQIQVRLQHRTDSVEFGSSVDVSSEDLFAPVGGITTQTTSGSLPLQILPSEQIKNHLQQMYSVLQQASNQIDPIEHETQARDALKLLVGVYAYHKNDQHIAISGRKRLIENYKETAERIRSDQEERQKEQERIANEQRRHEMEQRLKQEKQERLEQQKRLEKELLQKRIMQDRLERMKDPKLRKIIEDLAEDELQKLDHDLILQKQISHLEQEKREQANRLKQQEKKTDYFVRAMHLEEISLREMEYSDWAPKDKDLWEKYEDERIAKSVEERNALVDWCNRRHYIQEDAEQVILTIRQQRAEAFEKRMSDWEHSLKETRQKRLQERKDERKARRKEEWLQQKKEIEKRKKEEEEKRAKDLDMVNGGSMLRKPFQDKAHYPKHGYIAHGELKGADAPKWEKDHTASDASKWDKTAVAPGADFHKQRGSQRGPPTGEPGSGAESDNWRQRSMGQPLPPPETTAPRRNNVQSRPADDDQSWRIGMRQREQIPPSEEPTPRAPSERPGKYIPPGQSQQQVPSDRSAREEAQDGPWRRAGFNTSDRSMASTTGQQRVSDADTDWRLEKKGPSQAQSESINSAGNVPPQNNAWRRGGTTGGGPSRSGPQSSAWNRGAQQQQPGRSDTGSWR